MYSCFVSAFFDSMRSMVRTTISVPAGMLGVRTAVERETEPYDHFTQQFALNFPIYTDSTMSMAFAHFAKTVGIPTGLPTTAVRDEHGLVRFFLEPGDFRDTRQELGWAVDAVLGSASRATPPAPSKKTKGS